jgi:hypothetical protein
VRRAAAGRKTHDRQFHRALKLELVVVVVVGAANWRWRVGVVLDHVEHLGLELGVALAHHLFKREKVVDHEQLLEDLLGALGVRVLGEGLEELALRDAHLAEVKLKERVDHLFERLGQPEAKSRATAARATRVGATRTQARKRQPMGRKRAADPGCVPHKSPCKRACSRPRGRK